MTDASKYSDPFGANRQQSYKELRLKTILHQNSFKTFATNQNVLKVSDFLFLFFKWHLFKETFTNIINGKCFAGRVNKTQRSNLIN